MWRSGWGETERFAYGGRGVLLSIHRDCRRTRRSSPHKERVTRLEDGKKEKKKREYISRHKVNRESAQSAGFIWGNPAGYTNTPSGRNGGNIWSLTRTKFGAIIPSRWCFGLNVDWFSIAIEMPSVMRFDEKWRMTESVPSGRNRERERIMTVSKCQRVSITNGEFVETACRVCKCRNQIVDCSFLSITRTIVFFFFYFGMFQCQEFRDRWGEAAHIWNTFNLW